RAVGRAIVDDEHVGLRQPLLQLVEHGRKVLLLVPGRYEHECVVAGAHSGSGYGRNLTGTRGVLASMRFSAVLIATVALLAVPAATAKDFAPGDLRVCGRTQCVPIMNRSVLRVLSAYYWGPRRVPRAGPVRSGAPGFELRFAD